MSYPIEAVGEADQGHRRTRAPDKMLEVRLMWEKAALVEEVAFRQYWLYNRKREAQVGGKVG